MVVFPSASEAQSLEGLPVVSVQVEGNRAVSTQLIRAQLRVREGKVLEPSDIQKDISRLFSLGYFSDIKADVDQKDGGVVVTYIVEERKIIKEVLLLGNKKVTEEDIRAVIKARRGETYIPSLIERDIDAMIALYRTKGFSEARVEASYREISPTDVEIIYEITEGQKARVKEITIKHNQALSDRAIRKVMETKARFLWFGGLFDEQTLKEDLDRIKRLYANHGYIDAEVSDVSVEFTDDGKRVLITLAVNEGSQYFIDSIAIDGNKAFTSQQLLDLVKSSPGSFYNQEQVERDAFDMQSFYSDQGYILASVRPRLNIIKERHEIDVTYQVTEREMVYVGKVDIQGNVKTKDEVIRREINILPGERFDGGKIRRSRQKLLNTQFYKDVMIETAPTQFKPEVLPPPVPEPAEKEFEPDLSEPAEKKPEAAPPEPAEEKPRGEQPQPLEKRLQTNLDGQAAYEAEYRDLLFEVEEQKTGSFNFGAGYSSNDALIGQIQITQNNFDLFNPPTFTGAGQRFDLVARPGTLLSEYRLGLTEPYFLGYPFAAGFDLFYTSREYEDYTQSAVGAGFRFGKRITDYTSVSTGYNFSQYDISDVEDDAPQTIKDEEGNRTKSAINFGITSDTRDSYLDPTSGHRYVASLEMAGGPLGAETDIVKLVAQGRWYRPIGEKLVLMTRLEAGVVQEYGDSDFVPLFDRFFAGGATSVRGYKYRDVGPRVDGDPVGGKSLLEGTLELGYPLLEIIRVYTFFDFGQVWPEIEDFAQSKINTSVGVGIGLRTPVGPIRLDYGYPLNPDEDQGNGQIHFSTGISF
jgi:outer membrane protein insertion porin family